MITDIHQLEEGKKYNISFKCQDDDGEMDEWAVNIANRFSGVYTFKRAMVLPAQNTYRYSDVKYAWFETDLCELHIDEAVEETIDGVDCHFAAPVGGNNRMPFLYKTSDYVDTYADYNNSEFIYCTIELCDFVQLG